LLNLRSFNTNRDLWTKWMDTEWDEILNFKGKQFYLIGRVSCRLTFTLRSFHMIDYPQLNTRYIKSHIKLGLCTGSNLTKNRIKLAWIDQFNGKLVWFQFCEPKTSLTLIQSAQFLDWTDFEASFRKKKFASIENQNSGFIIKKKT